MTEVGLRGDRLQVLGLDKVIALPEVIPWVGLEMAQGWRMS